jgi:hypothetical protein
MPVGGAGALDILRVDWTTGRPSFSGKQILEPQLERESLPALVEKVGA